MGTWQSWVLQHPGGRREEIQGGSCWEGRQCQKTVETLLAAEQDCLGRGMEGSVIHRAWTQLSVHLGHIICAFIWPWEEVCCRVQGQAVCHHPRAVSYPSLWDPVTIHITVSHCFFKAHYWQGLPARHRSGVVLSMLNGAINVCHHWSVIQQKCNSGFWVLSRRGMFSLCVQPGWNSALSSGVSAYHVGIKRFWLHSNTSV